MPRPTEPGRRYVAGLDGIRALAVLCVIAYHLGFSWAAGGMLGVGVFFTLSGYLITDLLLGHWRVHGEMGLRTFWLRRARRLLPALFAMLAIVSVLVAVFDAGQLASVRRQVLSGTFYFANWSTIAQHGSYFSRFASPLPLDHLWSLSIEEQFYLVWPLVLLMGIWLMRNRTRLALMTLGMALASILTMRALHHPGYDPTRAYEGTDTRAFGLLIGAAVAMIWPSRTPRAAARPGPRRLLDLAGVAGLLGILALVARTTPFSSFLYPYGFVLLSVATAVLVAATVNPASRLGSALGWGPLRWIGVRSYGIYLWQWPIIVLIAPASAGFNLGRAALEVLATFAAAALSWRFLEDPIRRGALVRLRRRLRSGAGTALDRTRAIAFSGAAAVLSLPVVLGLAGLLPSTSTSSASAGSAALLKSVPRPVQVHAQRKPAHGFLGLLAASALHEQTRHYRRTSCQAVVYIGDSTSEGEISPNYIPNARQRLPSQLEHFGVRTVYPEISGARSIIETFEGHPNAATVAQYHVSQGYHGCWVLALGTNDAANVHAGGRPGPAGRIARMMSVIGKQPVLWVQAVTLQQPGGPYAEAGMRAWDRALMGACFRYPNLRVFDWPALARRKWFIPDGIHYYSPGYVARSHLISQGLADAYPAHRAASSSCLVR